MPVPTPACVGKTHSEAHSSDGSSKKGSVVARVASTNSNLGCGLDWDSVLAYETRKIVVIKDRWLGCLRLGTTAMVLVYFFSVPMFAQQAYLRFEPVRGSVGASVEEPSALKAFEQLPYCSQYAGEGPAPRQRPCFRAPGAHAAEGSAYGALFIATHSEERWANTTCLQHGGETADCVLAREESYIAQPENFHIRISHAVFRHTGVTMFSTLQGSLMPSDGTVEWFNPSDLLLHVDDLLEAGGLDLDSLNADDDSLRRSGTVLMLSIHYEHGWRGEVTGYQHNLIHVRQDTEVWKTSDEIYPADGTLSMRINKRSGLTILVRQTGVVGEMSLQSVLLSCVANAMLLRVARVLVDFLLARVMPLRDVYSMLKWEQSVDFSDYRRGDEAAMKAVNDLRKARRNMAGRGSWAWWRGSANSLQKRVRNRIAGPKRWRSSASSSQSGQSSSSSDRTSSKNSARAGPDLLASKSTDILAMKSAESFQPISMSRIEVEPEPTAAAVKSVKVGNDHIDDGVEDVPLQLDIRDDVSLQLDTRDDSISALGFFGAGTVRATAAHVEKGDDDMRERLSLLELRVGGLEELLRPERQRETCKGLADSEARFLELEKACGTHRQEVGSCIDELRSVLELRLDALSAKLDLDSTRLLSKLRNEGQERAKHVRAPVPGLPVDSPWRSGGRYEHEALSKPSGLVQPASPQFGFQARAEPLEREPTSRPLDRENSALSVGARSAESRVSSHPLEKALAPFTTGRLSEYQEPGIEHQQEPEDATMRHIRSSWRV